MYAVCCKFSTFYAELGQSTCQTKVHHLPSCCTDETTQITIDRYIECAEDASRGHYASLRYMNESGSFSAEGDWSVDCLTSASNIGLPSLLISFSCAACPPSALPELQTGAMANVMNGVTEYKAGESVSFECEDEEKGTMKKHYLCDKTTGEWRWVNEDTTKSCKVPEIPEAPSCPTR